MENKIIIQKGLYSSPIIRIFLTFSLVAFAVLVFVNLNYRFSYRFSAAAFLLLYLGVKINIKQSQSRGELYILSDSEYLRFKTFVFGKEKRIRWDEITKLSFKPTAVNVYFSSGEKQSIKFKWTATNINQAKAMISKVAKMKKISVY